MFTRNTGKVLLLKDYYGNYFNISNRFVETIKTMISSCNERCNVAIEYKMIPVFSVLFF